LSNSISLPEESEYDMVIDEYKIPPLQDVGNNLSEVECIIPSNYQSRLKN